MTQRASTLATVCLLTTVTVASPAFCQRRPTTATTPTSSTAAPVSPACENLPTLPENTSGTQPSTATVPGAATTTPTVAPSTGLSSGDISQRFLRCALDLFSHHQYRPAIRQFELAHRAAPSADLLYNVARSHELLSEYAEAADSYEHYLRDKVNAPDRAELETHIRELRDLDRRQREAATRQNAPTLLSVQVDRPGAELLLDDRSVGMSPLARPLEIATGVHTLAVRAAGFQLWRAEIRARQAETANAIVTLQPATEYLTQPPAHVLSYILGGLGIATIGASVGLGIYGATRCVGMAPPRGGPGDTNACETATVLETPAQITTTDCAMFPNALGCARESWTNLSTITGAVGVGLLTGAIITYFVEAGSGRTEQRRARPATQSSP